MPSGNCLFLFCSTEMSIKICASLVLVFNLGISSIWPWSAWQWQHLDGDSVDDSSRRYMSALYFCKCLLCISINGCFVFLSNAFVNLWMIGVRGRWSRLRHTMQVAMRAPDREKHGKFECTHTVTEDPFPRQIQRIYAMFIDIFLQIPGSSQRSLRDTR